MCALWSVAGLAKTKRGKRAIKRRGKTVCNCLKDDDLSTEERLPINALPEFTNETTKQPNSALPDPHLTLLFMPLFSRQFEPVAY